jgi:hypothetical protein
MLPWGDLAVNRVEGHKSLVAVGTEYAKWGQSKENHLSSFLIEVSLARRHKRLSTSALHLILILFVGTARPGVSSVVQIYSYLYLILMEGSLTVSPPYTLLLLLFETEVAVCGPILTYQEAWTRAKLACFGQQD